MLQMFFAVSKCHISIKTDLRLSTWCFLEYTCTVASDLLSSLLTHHSHTCTVASTTVHTTYMIYDTSRPRLPATRRACVPPNLPLCRPPTLAQSLCSSSEPTWSERPLVTRTVPRGLSYGQPLSRGALIHPTEMVMVMVLIHINASAGHRVLQLLQTWLQSSAVRGQ